MSEEEIKNDISHIMEEIIEANDFTLTLKDKNTEHEVKKMTLIILSEIYNTKQIKVKKFINQNYQQRKNHYVKEKNETGSKDIDNANTNSEIINIENNFKEECIKNNGIENSKKNNKKVINIEFNDDIFENMEIKSPINEKILENVSLLDSQEILIIKDKKPKSKVKVKKKKKNVKKNN